MRWARSSTLTSWPARMVSSSLIRGAAVVAVAAVLALGALGGRLARHVGGGLERGRDVHVEDRDRLGHVQRRGREAHDAAHACARERVGGRLGRLGRDGEDGDRDAQVADRLLHGAGGEDAAALDRLADLRRIVVEGGDDGELGATPGEVGEDRGAELADADQSHILAAGAVEELADAVDALLHLVAARGGARVADRHEVPADLRGGHAAEARELVGEDVRRALVEQRDEQPTIQAHAGDRLARDHGRWLLAGWR